jgi:predicted O-methyltransferase YrrM
MSRRVTGRRGVVRGTVSAWSEGGVTLALSRTLRRAAEALENAADRVDVGGAARRVRRMQPATFDDAIDFAEQFRFAGRISIRPMQIRSEIRSFLDFVASEPPETVLEIGTGRGGTLFLLAQAARENALLVSLDAPDDARFGARPEYAARARLYRSLGRRTQRVVFLAADSHVPETLAHVRQILAGRLIDVLFIDGDHTFEGVASDFRMYAPLVRSGGLVAFHDIVPGLAENVGGVPAFWQSVRAPDSVEFVEDWDQGAYGIGVLRR